MKFATLARLALGLACGAALLTAPAARAADPYPTGPVRLVVSYAAGGVGDIAARAFAEKVAADLGQPVVVENRPGAGGALGAQFVARSRPDGYTVGALVTAHVILPGLQQVPYDFQRDFTPVYGTASVPLVFAVSGKSTIRSFEDLAAKARTMPGGINYASGGAGSISHLAAVRLLESLKIKGTHVPFKGFSAAVQGLLGEQVDLICAGVSDVLALTKSGDFRAIAVSSEERLPQLPEVRTLAQVGVPDFAPSSWNAWFVPAGTPPEVVERLARAFAKAGSDPDLRDKLGKLGVTVKARSGADLGKFVRDESERWRRVIQENNLKLEN